MLTDVDGVEKKISVKTAIILMVLTFEAAAIYFRFQHNEQRIDKIEELHTQDINHLKEQMAYERERVDRKFKRFEQ